MSELNSKCHNYTNVKIRVLRNENINNIRCSFKFVLKEAIVNAARITDHGSAVCVVCRLASGAFTIDSSTPTLRRNLNEHPL
jgi:hypothetical protein